MLLCVVQDSEMQCCCVLYRTVRCSVAVCCTGCSGEMQCCVVQDGDSVVLYRTVRCSVVVCCTGR